MRIWQHLLGAATTKYDSDLTKSIAFAIKIPFQTEQMGIIMTCRMIGSILFIFKYGQIGDDMLSSYAYCI